MKTVNVELNLNEISVLRAIIFEYYHTLKQDYMCEEEREAHVTLEKILADAENDIFRS